MLCFHWMHGHSLLETWHSGCLGLWTPLPLYITELSKSTRMRHEIINNEKYFLLCAFAFFVLSDAIDCTISQGDHAACMTRNVWLYYMWGTHPPLETISVICFKSRCNFLLFWFQFVDFSNIVLTSVCTMVLLRFPSIFIHFSLHEWTSDVDDY